MSYNKVVIYTDGGARGNPGPAGIGAVIYNHDGLDIIETISKYIGVATNNHAEYMALIAALEKAHQLKAHEVDCYLDSELLVKQLKREYRVKEPNLASLFTKVWNLAINFKKINFYHVRREKNKEADKLVNQALDNEIKKMHKENSLDVSIQE